MNFKTNSLSVIVCTYQSESSLEACLKSLSFADELIVVDAGSDDRSFDIAERHTQLAFIHPCNNLASLKQAALKAASGDWVLFVEAHEQLSYELRQEIEGKFLQPLKDIQAFEIPIRMHLAGEPVTFGLHGKHRELRLIRRSHAVIDDTQAESPLIYAGPHETLETGILSHPYSSISSLFQSSITRAEEAAFKLLEEGRLKALESSLPNLLWQPAWAFFKAYYLSLGFKDGLNGLVWAKANSVYEFIKYSKARYLYQSAQNADLL